MRHTPTLSVVIPTYGRTGSLLRLLRSVEAQSLAPVQVVVVDQNPAGYLDAVLARVPGLPVQRVRMEPNAAAARNRGFAASRGSHVLFVDDDQVLDPGFCAHALSVVAEHPAVRCLWPVVYSGDERESQRKRWLRRTVGPALPGTGIYRVKTAGSGGILFERGYFRETGGFDEVLFGYVGMSEDCELMGRMRRKGMHVWLDASLSLLHDTTQPGGCGMRTRRYRGIRARSVRSHFFQSRIRRGAPFHLRLRDVLTAPRYAFLTGFGRPGSRARALRSPLWHLRLIFREMRRSRELVRRHGLRYALGTEVDHLRRYDPAPRADHGDHRSGAEAPPQALAAG